MTVYLVEDEDNIRQLVTYTLNAGGYETHGFADAQAFYGALAGALPDLVLLDIMLPGEDGIAVLKKLRAAERTKKLPVILLTARDAEYDKVLGLDAGADDYVTKPFGMMELMSRVKALLRRTQGDGAPAAELRAGPLVLQPGKHVLEKDGQPLALTLKEFELLRVLMENPGIVLTRDMLLEQVWGYSYEGETRTVDVHVRSLRQKLGDASERIETVRGVGYKLREER